VASILNGYAFPSRAFHRTEGFPLIRIRDVGNTSTSLYFGDAYDPKYVVEKGDLLVGMDGDFRASIWDGQPALLNQRVCKVIPDPTRLRVRFLGYILPGYLNAIHGLTSSTTVTHLSSRDLQQLPIPVPSLKEQDVLVAHLDVVAQKRAAVETHISACTATLTHLRQSILMAGCFGRLTAEWRHGKHQKEVSAMLARIRASGKASGRQSRRTIPNAAGYTSTKLPTQWTWARCGDLCLPARALTYGVIKLGESVPDGVPTLRSSNVRYLEIDLRGVKSISPSISEAYQRTVLHSGEIVVTVRGTLGGVAVVPEELRGFNVSREVAVVPIHPSMNAQFFAYAIGSLPVQNSLTGISKGVAYTGINIEDLKVLSLPVPPRAEQDEIVRRIEMLLGLASSINARADDASARLGAVTVSALASALVGDRVLPDLVSN